MMRTTNGEIRARRGVFANDMLKFFTQTDALEAGCFVLYFGETVRNLSTVWGSALITSSTLGASRAIRVNPTSGPQSMGECLAAAWRHERVAEAYHFVS